jgi:hypothetical protein
MPPNPRNTLPHPTWGKQPVWSGLKLPFDSNIFCHLSFTQTLTTRQTKYPELADYSAVRRIGFTSLRSLPLNSLSTSCYYRHVPLLLLDLHDPYRLTVVVLVEWERAKQRVDNLADRALLGGTELDPEEGSIFGPL